MWCDPKHTHTHIHVHIHYSNDYKLQLKIFSIFFVDANFTKYLFICKIYHTNWWMLPVRLSTFFLRAQIPAYVWTRNQSMFWPFEEEAKKNQQVNQPNVKDLIFFIIYYTLDDDILFQFFNPFPYYIRWMKSEIIIIKKIRKS